MRRKKFFIFLTFLFSFAITNGQNNLTINFVDNSSVTVAFGDIQRIAFLDDTMLLEK